MAVNNDASPATHVNCIIWPTALVRVPPRSRVAMDETVITCIRMSKEMMILNIRMLSSTEDASSMTGSAIPPENSESAPTSVSTKPEATPAMASPSWSTMEVVTLSEATLEISRPRATPHIVLAERARRLRK